MATPDIIHDLSSLSLSLPEKDDRRDLISDSDHEEMDQAILETFDAYYVELKRQPPLGLLLMTISSGDKRLKHLTLDEAEAHLKKPSDLEETLKRSWDAKSFKEVRLLKILWPPQPEVQQGAKQQSQLYWLEAAFRSFNRNYIGQGHQVLLAAMDWHLSTLDSYNRSISIVQSSGAGKSRTVDKAAELRFAFPLNLRDARDMMVKSYPPSDEAVRAYLVPSVQDTDRMLYRRYACFLVEMFSAAETPIRAFNCGTHATLAKKWHDWLAEGGKMENHGQNRTKFYQDVIENAKIREKGIADELHEDGTETLREGLKSAIRSLEGRLCLDNTFREGHGKCSFFIYIDEAESLTEEPKDGRTRTAYHALGHVLGWIHREAVFTLFLSTNSRFRSIAPSARWHPSSREWGQVKLFPPFTELPFDVFAQKMRSRLEAEKALTLDRLCSLKEMVKFGRPLWSSQSEYSIHSDDIIEFARRKLALPVGQDADYATLDVRIRLSFDATNIASREVVSSLVASHMRLVYVVPEHREFMHSGYSSEPILAEAAARLLNDGGDGAIPPLIASKGPDILSAAYRSDLLARGERGETVGRLLMTIAHDSVIMKMNPDLSASEAIFHRPIKVIDFLQHLFHSTYHSVILDAGPVKAHKNSKTLREAYKNAYLSFSHFAQAGDTEAAKLGKIHKYLFRGLALQCTYTQKSIDMAIPVFFGNPKNGQISEKKTSVLQVQIKNRKKPENERIKADIVLMPKEGTPVLSLFLELGSESSSVETLSGDKWVARSQNNPDAHHYMIKSHGCSSRVFSAIPERYDNKYQELLAATEIVKDLTRRTLPGSVEMVYAMLFSLLGRKDGQHWSWAD